MTDHRWKQDVIRRFEEAIDKTDLPTLRAAWETQTARTVFYKDIFQKVGNKLELDLESQLLIVDMALVGRHDRVPRVFIESENIATSAIQEVRKLCCLSAPLKVLLAVCEWDETSGVWLKGMRPLLLREWTGEVARHAAAGSLVGDVIAIVAEWSSAGLRFFPVDLRSGDNAEFHVLVRSEPIKKQRPVE